MAKKPTVKGKKWTPEQREKFALTLAAKKAASIGDEISTQKIEKGEIPSNLLPLRPRPKAPMSVQKKVEYAARARVAYQAKKAGATAIQTDVRYQIALELISLIRNILSTG